MDRLLNGLCGAVRSVRSTTARGLRAWDRIGAKRQFGGDCGIRIDQRGVLGTEYICIEHPEALGTISDPVTTKILPERKIPRSVSETITVNVHSARFAAVHWISVIYAVSMDQTGLVSIGNWPIYPRISHHRPANGIRLLERTQTGQGWSGIWPPGDRPTDPKTVKSQPEDISWSQFQRVLSDSK